LADNPLQWKEGVNYFLVQPAQPTSLPKGKVEVTEVFSYACPYCNVLLPSMQKLRQTLPRNAVLNYLPAGFNPSEDWPMFQLAYCTAESLGVVEQTHEAMFNAVWKTGELAVLDPSTKALKSHLPTITDAARFYNRKAGVPVAKFLQASKSFDVNRRVGNAESLIERYRISGTPSIVVNGKYRLDVSSAGGYDQLVRLVIWLVAKESK
jgi:thiol:disulfide interchange protein DsbA